MRSMGSHHRPNEGITNDWLTPPSVIQSFPVFDLDPCATEGQPWSTAKTMWTVKDDGLNRDWFGTVWLNPPYGPHVWKWLDKLATHGDGIALIFARTETAGFQRHVFGKASGLLFLAGRLHFHRPITGERADFNAGAPSVLVAYGRTEWLRRSRLPGKVVGLV